MSSEISSSLARDETDGMRFCQHFSPSSWKEVAFFDEDFMTSLSKFQKIGIYERRNYPLLYHIAFHHHAQIKKMYL